MKATIIIIGSAPPPYHGVNIYIDNLLRSKISENYDILFLNTSDRREDLDNFGKPDFRNVFNALKNLIQLTLLCIRVHPSLVYICPSQNLAYVREGLFILAVKTFSKAKIIEHLHGGDFLRFYERSNRLFRYFIDGTQRLADKVIVLGESLRYIFSKWLKDDDIVVVPNGTDLFLKERLEKSYDTINFYYLGNMMKFKGIMVILSALAIVKEQYPSVKVQFAGSWGFDMVYNLTSEKVKTEFEEGVKRLNLAENIEFIGLVSGDAKTELLKKSTVLLYPTLHDGFPIVLLEAMAAGNAVISTAGVGAIDDVVQHGVTGVLVEKGNETALSDAMLRFLEDPSLQMKMGVEGRRRYEQNFTFGRTIDKMIEVFDLTIHEEV